MSSTGSRTSRSGLSSVWIAPVISSGGVVHVAHHEDEREPHRHLRALHDAGHGQREDPPVPDGVVGGEKQGVHHKDEQEKPAHARYGRERGAQRQTADGHDGGRDGEQQRIAEPGVRAHGGGDEDEKAEKLRPRVQPVQDRGAGGELPG